MIRPLSLLCVLLAAGSGLYLYQAKQHGRMLDQQIRETRELTERTRQRIEVLRADYTLLNDPSRLAELVGANLPDLKPTQPAQWTSMADLDKRLPPVGGAKPAAEPAPLTEEGPPVASLEPAPHEPVAEAPAPDRAPAPVVAEAPARMRATTVADAPPPRPAATIAATPLAPPAPRPTVVASVPRRVAPRPAPVPATSPSAIVAEPLAPSRAPVRTVAVRPPPSRVVHTPPPSPTAVAIARIAHGAPVDPSVPVVASALGMAQSMSLPAAIAPANAATMTPAGGGR